MDSKFTEKIKKYTEKIKNIQNGGKNKSSTYTDIIDFIMTEPIKKIINDLPRILVDEKNWCDKIIGEGMMGKVSISEIGNTVEFKLKDKNIIIPVVTKKARQAGIFGMKIIKKKLYIYSYENIVTEALILLFTRKIWHKMISPHLPLIIGFGSCDKNINTILDTIITERHGLDEPVEIKKDGYIETPLIFPEYNREHENKSTLATLYELMIYINLKKKGNSVILPNSETCDIIELCDYLTISYLHTHDLLLKNNITLYDMHNSNIFIHWLNKNSYMGDKNIQNIKYIIYKFNDKYIKIKTFGLILKIGDIGASILQPRTDIVILGLAGGDIEKHYNLVDQLVKPNYTCHKFLYNIQSSLSTNLYEKTIAYKILSSYPYAEINRYKTIQYNLLYDMLTPYEMLEKYEKYIIDKPKNIKKIKNSKNILVIG
jgi:hypothetical protein